MTALPRPLDELRVLAIIPGDGEGSSYIFARREIEALHALGCTTVSYYMASRDSPSALLAQWRAIRREIREASPQVVHVHYGTVTAFVAALAVGKLPLVVTFRGSDLNGDPGVSKLRGWVGRVLSQLAALRANRIICVSRKLRERLWWRGDRAVVVPSAVDIEMFRPIPRAEARRHLGLDDDARIVLFNGGGRAVLKGLEFVQDVVAEVERSIGPVKLVELDGSVPPAEMPYYASAADCLVLASLREGSPNIVKEALACNLPVVSTDVGDVAERLENVEPSCVAPRETEPFARAVASVLTARVRSNGREHIRALAVTRVSAAIREIYDSIVRAGPDAVE